MFTGLIQAIGEVVEVTHRGRSSRFTVESDLDLTDVTLGESIAINGPCFTVVAYKNQRFSVDVSPESLDRTTLGRINRGDRVHLERALRLSDRLGGHLVLGHVDGVGELLNRTAEANATHLRFSAPAEVSAYLVPKGGIAIHGVSLTVNQCDDSSFDVTIVPHTAQQTLLTTMSVGTSVNLEADIIGKYVAGLLGAMGAESRSDKLVRLLRERGFVGLTDSFE